MCGTLHPSHLPCQRCAPKAAPRSERRAAVADDVIALATRAAYGDWSSDRRMSTDVRLRLECDETTGAGPKTPAEHEALFERAKPALLMPRIGETPRRQPTVTTEISFRDPDAVAIDPVAGRTRLILLALALAVAALATALTLSL
jgi:hypothetical protein